MKVVIGLFGISHKESNVNWLRWWLKYDIDYRKCVDNYKKYLFDHFKSEGFDVSTYISTYKSEAYEDLQTDLMKQYNPKFISMVDYQIQTPTNNLARNIIFSRLCHTILNQEELSNFKDGAFLVNVSRGGVVNEDALYESLTNGKLSAAALDVFGNEPYNGKFCDLDNVILTPHIGSYAKEGKLKMEVDAVMNLVNALK